MLKKILILVSILILASAGFLVFIISKNGESKAVNSTIVNQNIDEEVKVVEEKIIKPEFNKAFLNDQDQDGLSKQEEQKLGTNDQESDTDGDGLSDYKEVHETKTDPTKLDTDGDGFPDYIEILQGFDPNSK